MAQELHQTLPLSVFRRAVAPDVGEGREVLKLTLPNGGAGGMLCSAKKNDKGSAVSHTLRFERAGVEKEVSATIPFFNIIGTTDDKANAEFFERVFEDEGCGYKMGRCVAAKCGNVAEVCAHICFRAKDAAPNSDRANWFIARLCREHNDPSARNMTMERGEYFIPRACLYASRTPVLKSGKYTVVPE